jgi:GT2 family glycosyltransferase
VARQTQRAALATLAGSGEVTRLSIIVPLDGDVPRMEATLVSVLENRPRDCEVLVVLNGDYGDPYQLTDEVRFVQSTSKAGWAECINLAAREARGEIILPLTCGVEATDGWTQEPLEHFADPRVAAVAPLIVRQDNSPTICAAGTAYSSGGRRIVRGRGKPLAAREKLSRRAVSPTRCAGFYRRDSFLKLGGFSSQLGGCADVDLGLRIEAAGLGTVFEPASVLRASVGGAAQPAASGFSSGLHAERLFLRNLRHGGVARSLLLHPFTLLREVAANWRRPHESLARLVGRLAAWCEWPRHAAHYHRLGELPAAVAACRPTRATALRPEGSHALRNRASVLATAGVKQK